jgi:glycosyltransferase EpsH
MALGKVSIIIPAYNAENGISRLLEQIRKQTYRNYEVIVVNDGSEDRTEGMVYLHMQQPNHRIQLINIPHSNAGNARNIGIDHASGDYFWFIDADDEIVPAGLEIMVRQLELTHAEICLSPPVFFGIRGSTIPGSQYIFSSHYDGSDFSFWDYNPHNIPLTFNKDSFDQFWNVILPVPVVWSKLFARSLIERYRLRFQSIQSTNDWYFNYVACFLARSLTRVFTPCYLYNNSTNSNALTAQKSSNIYAPFNAWIELFETAKTYHFFEAYELSLRTAALKRISRSYSFFRNRGEIWERETVIQKLNQLGISNLDDFDLSKVPSEFVENFLSNWNENERSKDYKS